MKTTPPNWGTPPWTISFRPKQKPLPQQVDFAIVGAGFSGLSAAAHLKHFAPKKSVIVVESGSLGAGASGHTGGMALAESAAGPLPGLGNVLAGYKKILHDLRINAELDLPGAWELARGNRSMDGKRIRPRQLREKNPLIDWNDSGHLRVVNKVPGGTVHPGKVISGLALSAEKLGVSIFTDTSVTGFKPGKRIQVTLCRAGKTNTLEARRILFATNAASLALLGLLRAAEPKLTFALATAPLKKAQIKALGLATRRPFYTVDLPYLWGRLFPAKSSGSKSSSRKFGLILGSGLVPAYGETLRRGKEKSGELLRDKHAKNIWSGLEGVSVRRGQPADRLRSLESRVRAMHPALRKVRITHRWAGPILLTEDALPVFCHLAKSRNVILLAGFNGHGVALSVYLGKWAAQSLLGKRILPNWGPSKKSRKTVSR